MDRRRFIAAVSALAALPAAAKEAAPVTPLVKSKAEWKGLLPLDRYRVLFEEDTERPFSSALNQEKRAGVFVCSACFLPVFDSAHKFDSGTGWPSFWDTLPGAILSKKDFKLVWPRTEYHCARCGGHHGHVFNDGPKPTGLRYCNNGLALQFVPASDPLPALRT